MPFPLIKYSSNFHSIQNFESSGGIFCFSDKNKKKQKNKRV